ncbi:MAG: hypothetical protein MZW92_45115 [Comamonadaceae bacterium]|nr:hypothetical protein [Comamonadaceae bacterium]
MGDTEPGALHDPHRRRRRRHRGHLPERLHEPQRPAAGADHPHPGQAGLPAEPDAAELRPRQAAIAGQIQQAYSEEQHRHRRGDARPT